MTKTDTRTLSDSEDVDAAFLNDVAIVSTLDGLVSAWAAMQVGYFDERVRFARTLKPNTNPELDCLYKQLIAICESDRSGLEFQLLMMETSDMTTAYIYRDGAPD